MRFCKRNAVHGVRLWMKACVWWQSDSNLTDLLSFCEIFFKNALHFSIFFVPLQRRKGKKR